MADKPRKVKSDALAKALAKAKEDSNRSKQRQKINRAIEKNKINKTLKILEQASVDTVRNLEFFSRKERGPAEGTYEVQLDYSAKQEISAEENIGAVSNFTDDNINQIGEYHTDNQIEEVITVSSDEEMITVSSDEEIGQYEDFVLRYSSDDDQDDFELVLSDDE